MPPVAALRRAGEALYGDRWQSPLARDLGVAVRTMQRWTSGHPVPAGVWRELQRLLGERCEAIAALRSELAAAAGNPRS